MMPYIVPMNSKGAILGNAGEYNQPPFLSLPCGSSFGNVDIYKLNVSEQNIVSVVTERKKCFTYYCDLSADSEWNDLPMFEQDSTAEERKTCLASRNMSGDGSKENPWKNLTFALEKVRCIVNSLCCNYVNLVCSGTANYTVCYYENFQKTEFDGRGILILSGANVNPKNIGYYTNCGFYYLRNCLFYNCRVNIETDYAHKYGEPDYLWYSLEVWAFYMCEYSMFVSCETGVVLNSTSANEYSVTKNPYAFYRCSFSTFFECVTYVSASQNGFNHVNMLASAFYRCHYSTFYNCTTKANAESFDGGETLNGVSGLIECEAIAINDCENGKFYDCISFADAEGNAKSSASINAAALSECKEAEFYRCTAQVDSLIITEKVAYSSASGFSSCYDSSYFSCNAVAKTESTGKPLARSYANGYGDCGNSDFFECEFNVSAIASASPESGNAFTEEEHECGIQDDSGCKSGYRCEIRTEDGTKTC